MKSHLRTRSPSLGTSRHLPGAGSPGACSHPATSRCPKWILAASQDYLRQLGMAGPRPWARDSQVPVDLGGGSEGGYCWALAWNWLLSGQSRSLASRRCWWFPSRPRSSPPTSWAGSIPPAPRLQELGPHLPLYRSRTLPLPPLPLPHPHPALLSLGHPSSLVLLASRGSGQAMAPT